MSQIQVALKRLCKSAVFVSAATCLVFLGGCASTEQVAKSVLDGNLAQEMASNQLILLNIVRASQRSPMHFTRISTVRLPVGAGNPTFGLPIPFGADRTHLYTLSTQFGITQGVDTTVQDSQEFMQGISSPVQATLLQYYLDQGWPQSQILHMFVRVMQIYRKDPGVDEPQLIGQLENYPATRQKMQAFQEAVESMADCSFSFETVPRATPYGPMIEAASFKDLKAMAALRAADVAIVPVDSAGNVTDTKTVTQYRLAKAGKETEFSLSPKLGRKCAGVLVPHSARAGAIGGPATPQAAENALVVPLRTGTFSGDLSHVFSKPLPSTAGGTATYHASLTLRSPEAMLYYLGEIVRAQIKAQDEGGDPATAAPFLGENGWLASAPSSHNQALFRVERAASNMTAVSVDYLGRTYALPRSSESDRTMHTLWLVTQVLSLQNKGTATPVTSNVRLVN